MAAIEAAIERKRRKMQADIFDRSNNRPRDVPDKEFELALSEVIDTYRKCIPHQYALNGLFAQYQRVLNDDGWRDPASDDYQPGDIVQIDPEPQGAA